MTHRAAWIVTGWCVAVDLGLAVMVLRGERFTTLGAIVALMVLVASVGAAWLAWDEAS